MSDSDKFKEGYKKKGKGKATKTPQPPTKKQEVVEEPVEDDVEDVSRADMIKTSLNNFFLQEPESADNWDDGVVDSWDQIEVEQMPVPIKVRREEKKKRKEAEKTSKQQPHSVSPNPSPVVQGLAQDLSGISF